MDENATIELGSFCEGLLEKEAFTTIVSHFEQQCFLHWASTDAKNLKEREAIFNKMGALRDFLGHLRAYVAQKDDILAKQQELSEEDAQED
jgi:hypothetical protein